MLAQTRYLSRWDRKRYTVATLPAALAVEKHFRTFSHGELAAVFDPATALDANGKSTKRCHKRCLHAFNFTVKVHFDEFAAATGYTGPEPDVSVRTMRCVCARARVCVFDSIRPASVRRR